MRLRLLFLIPLLALISACAQGPQVAVVAPDAPAPIELTPPPPPAPPPPAPPKLPRLSTAEVKPESPEPIKDLSIFTFGDNPSARLVRLEADAFSKEEMEEWASAVEECLRLDEQINGVTVTFDLDEEASPVHEYAFELQGFVGEEGWCVDDMLFTEAYVEE